MWGKLLGKGSTFPFVGHPTPRRVARRSAENSGRTARLRSIPRNRARESEPREKGEEIPKRRTVGSPLGERSFVTFLSLWREKLIELLIGFSCCHCLLNKSSRSKHQAADLFTQASRYFHFITIILSKPCDRASITSDFFSSPNTSLREYRLYA